MRCWCAHAQTENFLTYSSNQAYFDSLRAELHGRVQVLDVEPSYIATNLGVNSWAGSGKLRGKGNDEHIKGGMTPGARLYAVIECVLAYFRFSEHAARRIVQGIACGEHELMLAPLLHRFVHCVRFLMPELYFFVMQRRDQMQREKAD